jgi:hypothetical protein
MIMGLPESGEAADPQRKKSSLSHKSLLLGARISRNKNIILFLSPGGRPARLRAYLLCTLCVPGIYYYVCVHVCSTRLHFHISYSAKQKTLSRVISPLINNDQEQKIATRPMPIISSLAAHVNVVFFCARHQRR